MQIQFKKSVTALCTRAALAAMLALGAGAASADPIHVAIDTSTFGTATGFIDMQLSATNDMPLATVLVDHMVGFDNTSYIESGGVTPVTGGYLFRNDTLNDLFHSVDMGGVLSFDLTFTGEPDPQTQYVSRFVVAAYDSDASTPLGHYDPFTGALATFAWTPATSAQALGTVDVSVSDPAVTAAPAAAVPEPASFLLAGIGLGALALGRRRRS